MKVTSLLALMLAFGSPAIAAEKAPIDFFEILYEAQQIEKAIGDRGIGSDGEACKFTTRFHPNGEKGNYALWFDVDSNNRGISLYILSQMRFEAAEDTLADGTVTKQISYKGKNFLEIVTVPGVSKTVKVGTEDAINCAVYY